MTKVDEAGIPLLVQHVKYKYSSFFLELTFFDGKKVQCEPEHLLRYSPEITDYYLSREQIQDAYQAAQGNQGRLLWEYRA